MYRMRYNGATKWMLATRSGSTNVRKGRAALDDEIAIEAALNEEVYPSW
jgi:hypothetical protein